MKLAGSACGTPAWNGLPGLLPVDVLGKPLRDLHAGFVPPEKDDPDIGRRLDAEMHQILTEGLPDFMHGLRDTLYCDWMAATELYRSSCLPFPGETGDLLLGRLSMM